MTQKSAEIVSALRLPSARLKQSIDSLAFRARVVEVKKSRVTPNSSLYRLRFL